MNQLIEAILAHPPDIEGISAGLAQCTAVEEESPLLVSLLRDFMEAQRQEMAAEKLPYTSKLSVLEQVQKKYSVFLSNILEMKSQLGIPVGLSLSKILEKSKNNAFISREDKLLLHQKKACLEEEVAETQSLGHALAYLALCVLQKIEIIGIEKKLMEVSSQVPEPSPHKASPLYLHKITSLSRPVHLTGKVPSKEMQKLLSQENGPSMSIEEYGERIKALLDKQEEARPRSIDASSEEETDSCSSDTKTRKLRRKEDSTEDIFYGDGNRMGKK
ncbi:hypothetical protein NECID01_0138 [Nematocida sp. AWRm77]|nr:hypothetical protein NECID01_0138 [Nematocida sp. AWRm77]